VTKERQFNSVAPKLEKVSFAKGHFKCLKATTADAAGYNLGRHRKSTPFEGKSHYCRAAQRGLRS